MPKNPPKPCRQPGCPNLTHNKYCSIHAPIHKRDSAYKRGYNGKWKVKRQAYLKKYPLCRECQRLGTLTMATVVDHIIPHRGDECLMWDEENWQPLCKQCHDHKTGKYDSFPVYEY